MTMHKSILEGAALTVVMTVAPVATNASQSLGETAFGVPTQTPVSRDVARYVTCSA